MYQNKLYNCKYKMLVICPSTLGKEPKDEQLCKRSVNDNKQ